MSSSKDSLLVELREKEHELEDAMMIVSLLQEQIKSKGGEEADKVTTLLEEIKDKKSLLPKVSFLQKGLYYIRIIILLWLSWVEQLSSKNSVFAFYRDIQLYNY